MATACVQSALYKGLPTSLSVWNLCSPLHPETFFLVGSDQAKAGDANADAIITNAKTLDAELSIANGPMSFVTKQLSSLTFGLILNSFYIMCLCTQI